MLLWGLGVFLNLKLQALWNICLDRMCKVPWINNTDPYGMCLKFSRSYPARLHSLMTFDTPWIVERQFRIESRNHMILAAIRRWRMLKVKAFIHKQWCILINSIPYLQMLSLVLKLTVFCSQCQCFTGSNHPTVLQYFGMGISSALYLQKMYTWI